MTTLEERFWIKVDLNGPVPEGRPELGPCWLWLASDDGYGYGQISAGARRARRLSAHQVAYEWLVGPVPEGLQLDHLCRMRRCVNPAHLEPVVCRVNVLRGATFAAENAAKTHCPQGHAYTPANTRVSKRGQRHCRTCNAERNRATQESRREEKRQYMRLYRQRRKEVT